MLEVKNSVTEIKTALDEVSTRLHSTEERSDELADLSIKTS